MAFDIIWGHSKRVSIFVDVDISNSTCLSELQIQHQLHSEGVYGLREKINYNGRTSTGVVGRYCILLLSFICLIKTAC